MSEMKPFLSWHTRIAYALPALSLAVIGIPVYVYLPKFYTDTVGISITTVGFLLLAVRVFDALTDPVIGIVSDRFISSWGRRRPFMAFGTLGLCISILYLFIPPESPGNEQVLRFAFWLFSMFFCWTLVTIPYESLGPELTEDYHERTALFGLRDGFLVLGTLLAAVSPAFASWILVVFNQSVTERLRFFLIAILYVPLILVCTVYCIHVIREKSSSIVKTESKHISGYYSVIRNKPFLILLAAYTIGALGSNLPATLILYYVQYVLEANFAEGFLILYFVSGIGFLPVWVMLSRKIGKKNAWICAMIINTGAFAAVFFLGPGDVLLYGILVTVSGIGFGAGLAIPSAIQADVIDYDEMKTGKRQEGLYIGLWSVSKKLAAALGVGSGLVLLGSTGYSPNIAQSPDVIHMLRILYALVPSLCNGIAILIILYYPITEERYKEIQNNIHKQKTR